MSIETNTKLSPVHVLPRVDLDYYQAEIPDHDNSGMYFKKKMVSNLMILVFEFTVITFDDNSRCNFSQNRIEDDSLNGDIDSCFVLFVFLYFLIRVYNLCAQSYEMHSTCVMFFSF